MERSEFERALHELTRHLMAFSQMMDGASGSVRAQRQNLLLRAMGASLWEALREEAGPERLAEVRGRVLERAAALVERQEKKLRETLEKLAAGQAAAERAMTGQASPEGTAADPPVEGKAGQEAGPGAGLGTDPRGKQAEGPASENR